jgi:molybdate transport system regulatory protein
MIPSAPRLRIRIVLAPSVMLGPGKADLLDGIGRTGSIAAAGRAMGMSYKRAWDLVGILNGMFRDPLVETVRGGPGGGHAALTDLGREVLTLYRRIEAQAAAGGAEPAAELAALLRTDAGADRA